MKKTIGFTEVMYTLWQVGEVYEHKIYWNGLHVGTNYKQDVVFVQNLSKDLERAKLKLAGEEFDINLELRGHSSFSMVVRSEVKNREQYYPQDCFSFGRMEGTLIANCTDVWQLKRALREEISARRRVCARRRLIDLGELVLHPHTVDKNEDSTAVRVRYTTPANSARMKYEDKVRSMSGHHFTNGEKITVEVKELENFRFIGKFGYTSVITYETKCGKVLKYVGSKAFVLLSDREITLTSEKTELRRFLTSEDCADERELLSADEIESRWLRYEDIEYTILPEEATKRPEWCTISATIKHDIYKNQPETKLLRMKIQRST